MESEVPLRELTPTRGTRLPPYGMESTDTAEEYAAKITRQNGDTSKYKQFTDEDLPPRVPKDPPKTQPKRIDFVLVYERKNLDELHDPADRRKLKQQIQMRDRFEKALLADGLELQEDVSDEMAYVKIHVPFERLCLEAERCKLEMPLDGCEIYDDVQKDNCWTRFEAKHLITDNEIDYVSAPFERDKMFIYEGHENEDTFFRPTLRYFLTNHILINMDISNRTEEEKEEDPMARKGLPYMMHKEYYSDSFVLHDETADDPLEREEIEAKLAKKGEKMTEEEKLRRKANAISTIDTRKELDDTWCKFTKYQPIWKIRNYFGEKIALYFAWSGTLISTLWMPSLVGLIVFFYGLALSFDDDEVVGSKNITANNTEDDSGSVLDESLELIKEAFDNDGTPFFALIICIWGTVFLEIWKRKNATLAYEWDVDNFEEQEPDRPQFFGTKMKPDPVTMEDTWYYPMKQQLMKFLTSGSILIMMVCLVCISAAAVILYRVIMSIDFCENATPMECLIGATVISSVLNSSSIMILGKVYERLAAKLTDWENHRTQTQYDDALILKLFAFQFANNYTSLFYIAFFRGQEWENGIFGMGSKYQDTCGEYEVIYTENGNEVTRTSNSCMSMLSFQVLTLMIMKPLPKFIKDVVLEWVKRKWSKRTFCRKKNNQVDEEPGTVKASDFLERERQKPSLGDFTMQEYTEKVIIYGFLMLFATSFSLAPLIVLLVNLIDMRVDGKRMLWWYRRPISRISEDIGMWYNILQFLNICGVISNAFLIAFTSTWGSKYSDEEKLWIVIIFENGVFAFKFLVATVIPDVPAYIELAMKREKYQVSKILERAANDQSSALAKKFSFISPLLVVQSKSLVRRDQEIRDAKARQSLADPGSAGPRRSAMRTPALSTADNDEVFNANQPQTNTPAFDMKDKFEDDPVTDRFDDPELGDKSDLKRAKKKKKYAESDLFDEPDVSQTDSQRDQDSDQEKRRISIADSTYQVPTVLPRMLTPLPNRTPGDATTAGAATSAGGAALLRSLPIAAQGLQEAGKAPSMAKYDIGYDPSQGSKC